jgi:endonuclease/exonuclease/phosphatase family metal-dependent hydrolase
MDGRVLPRRIAEVIGEFTPDVIGLQEVFSDQAEFLAHALGMHLAIGEVRKLHGGIYCNVVLSRFPVHSFCTFDLSAPQREQRGCVRTDVLIGADEQLHVFNLHLGTSFMERRWQARRIVEVELMRAKDLVGPRVVLGDFNEWTRGLVSQTLAAEFQSADIRLLMKLRRTYPGFLPILHLDHIYYDHDLIAEHVAVHRTMKALLASDHLPLFADFVIKEPT